MLELLATRSVHVNKSNIRLPDSELYDDNLLHPVHPGYNPSESKVAALQRMYSQCLSLYMQHMQSQAISQQSQVLLQQFFGIQEHSDRPVNFNPNAVPAAAVGEATPNAAMVIMLKLLDKSRKRPVVTGTKTLLIVSMS